MNEPIHTAHIDRLRVEVYADREALGAAAARAACQRIEAAVSRTGRCRGIFAAAPSQNELLAHLRAARALRWDAVEAFHMDEYIGLPAGAPQRFSHFLRTALFDHVPLKAVHLLDQAGLPIADEMARYADMLASAPIDVVCLGVGENGHIAFNDPPVADFNDSRLVKEVQLDLACRLQQVNDGAFATLAAVPERAMTLTVPALMRGESLICVVPGERKAAAIQSMLCGPIEENCPASILRRHDDCTLYLDAASAALWLESAGR
ncbi:6-phosphogluconolactonase [Propionivibrio dicarboxylicus]|uniref:Glucosamine-6-phosphate deaminase n=1 Tax=Propionivibrio dicarboxylicus TaxID=83767 RepID=A0A1G7XT40_9RHOO|nr:6-phosphogluconolactonase [Propionivibrio dicarboxylicus]SDG87173.1 glucosamine-6-phosphate deaminase [Propionivibrio dicarboxylicus]